VVVSPGRRGVCLKLRRRRRVVRAMFHVKHGAARMAKIPNGSTPVAPVRLGSSTLPPEARRGRGATANPTGRYETAMREVFRDPDWEPDEPATLRTQVTLERATRIIARNTSPDIPFDRSVNPYRGCEHG